MRRHSPKAEKQLKHITTLIDSARRFREAEKIDETFNRMVDLYRGKQIDTVKNEDQIVINMCKTIVDTILPSVALNKPEITVSARDAADEDRATIAEAVINYQFGHFNFKDELNLALLDSLIMGIGIVKSGWRYVEEERDRSADHMQADLLEALNEADEYGAEHSEMEGSVASDEQIAAAVPATEYAIVADHPFVERVSPFDVFFDPQATSMREVKWVAQRVYRPLVDAKNDPRYDREARKELTAAGVDRYTSSESASRWSTFNRMTNTESEVACVWEFYDLRNGIMCVIGDGASRFLVKPSNQPYNFGHPFEMLLNYQIPERLYPMGDLESIQDLQAELNATRSQLMNHRKKNIRKYMYKKAAFSPTATGQLKSDEDNALVEVEDGFEFAEALAPLPVTPVSADMYQAEDQILSNISMVSAQNDYQLGLNSPTRKTATESSIINDVASGRSEAKRQKYEHFCGRIARKIMMLNQQFVTGEQVARIVGQDGAQYWLPYELSDILGEFDFEVEFGSTQPMNKAGEMRKAQDMAMALAPFVQMGIVDPTALARSILSAFGEKNPGKFIMAPQIDPMTGLPMPPMPPGGPPPPGMPPGPPGATQGPPGQTPRDMAQQGVSPQMAALQGQLSGQVGLQLNNPIQSPDNHQ